MATPEYINTPTYREWFNQLPEPVAEKAIANTPTEWLDKSSGSSSLEGAMTTAFSWSGSPEGDNYWVKEYKKVKASKDRPSEDN